MGSTRALLRAGPLCNYFPGAEGAFSSPKETEVMKTLIRFKDWSVCQSDDRLGGGRYEVYAEHVTCSQADATDPEAAWSWEFRDGVRRNGYEACWECEAKVPNDVIALVVLHNWGRRDKEV